LKKVAGFGGRTLAAANAAPGASALPGPEHELQRALNEANGKLRSLQADLAAARFEETERAQRVQTLEARLTEARQSESELDNACRAAQRSLLQSQRDTADALSAGNVLRRESEQLQAEVEHLERRVQELEQLVQEQRQALKQAQMEQTQQGLQQHRQEATPAALPADSNNGSIAADHSVATDSKAHSSPFSASSSAALRSADLSSTLSSSAFPRGSNGAIGTAPFATAQARSQRSTGLTGTVHHHHHMFAAQNGDTQADGHSSHEVDAVAAAALFDEDEEAVSPPSPLSQERARARMGMLYDELVHSGRSVDVTAFARASKRSASLPRYGDRSSRSASPPSRLAAPDVFARKNAADDIAASAVQGAAQLSQAFDDMYERVASASFGATAHRTVPLPADSKTQRETMDDAYSKHTRERHRTTRQRAPSREASPSKQSARWEEEKEQTAGDDEAGVWPDNLRSSPFVTRPSALSESVHLSHAWSALLSRAAAATSVTHTATTTDADGLPFPYFPRGPLMAMSLPETKRIDRFSARMADKTDESATRGATKAVAAATAATEVKLRPSSLPPSEAMRRGAEKELRRRAEANRVAVRSIASASVAARAAPLSPSPSKPVHRSVSGSGSKPKPYSFVPTSLLASSQDSKQAGHKAGSSAARSRLLA
jgi:hypothetical protein